LARVVAEDEMDAAIEAEVVPYLDCAPEAVARAKRLAQRLGAGITEDDIHHTIGELAACWTGDEAPEGIAAFFAKRKPRWQGGDA